MFFYGFLVGVVTGMFTAWRRKGNYLDMLQYGAGFGIAFGIVTMIIGVLWARAGL
jgi:hypothetical protein